VRHIPAATRHLCHVLLPLQPGRHLRRRLLLAGRHDVTDGVIVRSRDVHSRRRADDLLRHSDVILHVTCTEEGLLSGAWGDDRVGTPGRIYRYDCSTIN